MARFNMHTLPGAGLDEPPESETREMTPHQLAREQRLLRKETRLNKRENRLARELRFEQEQARRKEKEAEARQDLEWRAVALVDAAEQASGYPLGADDSPLRRFMNHLVTSILEGP